jgi:ABC-2 type transport system permease protein
MSAVSEHGVTESVPERGSFRGLSDAGLVVRQVGFEQLSFWLNPIGALMTIAFSVVFLILLGATAGKSTVGSYGGIKLIDYYVAGFCGYGVMASCFTILGITLVNRRETGLLKRLRLSPLPTWMAMDALIINAIIVAAIGVLLLLVVGWLGYGVSGPAHWGPFIVTLLVAMVCYSAMGVGVSTLVPNQDSAGPIVSLTFFILVALSGLWFPIAPGSGLATFADFFPIRHLIDALVGSFTGERGTPYWPWRDVGVMLIWGVGGIVVGLRRWSWSPKRG